MLQTGGDSLKFGRRLGPVRICTQILGRWSRKTGETGAGLVDEASSFRLDEIYSLGDLEYRVRLYMHVESNGRRNKSI